MKFTVGVKNLAGPNREDAVAEEIRHKIVDPTPEIYTHDADGNLTKDGRWDYQWDAENRLIVMETTSTAVTAGLTKQKLEFTYDAAGRRIRKVVSAWNATTAAYAVTKDNRFVYDGWNLLAELDGLVANQLLCVYTWGLDLSGRGQGAGGRGRVA